MSKEQKLELVNFFKKKMWTPAEAQEVMDGDSLAISVTSLKDLIDRATEAE